MESLFVQRIQTAFLALVTYLLLFNPSALASAGPIRLIGDSMELPTFHVTQDNIAICRAVGVFTSVLTVIHAYTLLFRRTTLAQNLAPSRAAFGFFSSILTYMSQSERVANGLWFALCFIDLALSMWFFIDVRDVKRSQFQQEQMRRHEKQRQRQPQQQ